MSSKSSTGTRRQDRDELDVEDVNSMATNQEELGVDEIRFQIDSTEYVIAITVEWAQGEVTWEPFLLCVNGSFLGRLNSNKLLSFVYNLRVIVVLPRQGANIVY